MTLRTIHLIQTDAGKLIMNDLERLVAIDQIGGLMARYARYADGKQWDG